MHYYEAFSFNVTTSGQYVISTRSNLDTYGYLYNSRFNITNLAENLIVYDDEGCGDGQFGLIATLQPRIKYVVIVTTYFPDYVGAFVLRFHGSGNIILS